MKAQAKNKPVSLPPQVQTLVLQAEQMKNSGKLVEALNILAKADDIAPNTLIILGQIAGFCHLLGRTQDSLHYAKAALQLDPNHPQTLKIYGAALIDNGQSDMAIPVLQKVWRISKSDPQILRLLVHALFSQDRHEEGMSVMASYKDITRNASLLELALEGHHFFQQEDEAIALAEQGVRNNPGDPTFLGLMAVAYANAGDYEQELNYAKQASQTAPDNLHLACNYAISLQNVRRVDEALNLYNQLLEDHPDHKATLLVNKATLLKQMHALEEAETCAREALTFMPLSAEAHDVLGQILQLQGRYRDSWPHLEYHWHVPGRAKFRPTSDIPLWYGDDDLNGQSLLIFEDQGVGDTLLFMRFLKPLKELYPDCDITVMAERKMADIVSLSMGDLCTVMIKQDSQDKVLKADFMCAISTLPFCLNTDIDTLPPCPALKLNRQLSYKENEDDFIIGITWRTVSLHAGNKRSIELADFAPLAAIDNVKLVNLQYGDTAQERASCPFDIIHDDTVDPFQDMQAHLDQIAACDLIITIDNSTAHAAASLNKPVWVMLPYDCYWRVYNHDQSATPWYPSMTLFRQSEDRLFEPVLKTIIETLKANLGHENRIPAPPAFQTPKQPPSSSQTKALLMNDTSDYYHWGCNATSTAITEQLETRGYCVEQASFAEIAQTSMTVPSLSDFDARLFLSNYMYSQPTLFDKIRRCDHLTINGEGTIHSLNNNAVRLMYLAYITKMFFAKTVHIINHACFPESNDQLTDPNKIAYYRKTYQVIDDVAVRDPISHHLLDQLQIPNKLAFDSLPIKAMEWLEEKQREGQQRSKTIILAGSSRFSSQSLPALKRMGELIHEHGYQMAVLTGAKIHRSNDDAEFMATLRQALGQDPTIIDAHSLDEWFTHLYTSPLLISGRFHYTIAAASLGTPFIAFEGNTPKLHALSEFLEEEPPLQYTDPDLTPKISLKLMKILDNLPEKTVQKGPHLDRMVERALENYTGF